MNLTIKDVREHFEAMRKGEANTTNEYLMTPKPLVFEKWRSSENRTEIHIFIEGTQIYVMGFNPNLIDVVAALELLSNKGYDISKLMVLNELES